MPDLAASHYKSHYLTTRVTTASQPELQLMLLDGAWRFAQAALQAWHDEAERQRCDEFLARAIAVLEELAASVSRGATDASRRLAEEYAFIYRQLAAAQINRDAAVLDEALRLIAFQRETWKLACEKLRPAAELPVVVSPADSHAPLAASPADDALLASGRLSLQA